MQEGSRLWRLWALNQVKMKGSSSGKPEDNKVSLHASFLSTSCGGVFHSLGYKTLSNMVQSSVTLDVAAGDTLYTRGDTAENM